MKILLILSLCVLGIGTAYAEKGTFVDTVEFIQYLDESTALEEVKKGTIDLYYSRIPIELLQDQNTQNISVYHNTAGSFSLLVNPAESESFNPFYYQKARFALNYLVDRKLIVDELMAGSGVIMTSNYGPYDPDFLYVVDDLEKFNFTYDPDLANTMFSEILIDAGAKKLDGKWYYDTTPIEITVFIRNDDSIRKSIGEMISTELEKIGFVIKKDYGDLNKAYVVVYGSDPSELKWSLYTEGYSGRSAFVKYDPIGLAQMYAPWYSNMPGFNNPQYWNYKNQKIDALTQMIYSSNFTTPEQRVDLIRQATKEGVTESVRVFLVAKIDPFIANKNVSGIINDFGSGIQSRFTPINAKTGDSDLRIGVKQIYQGAWNPVRGFGDAYSRNVWDVLYDPGMFKDPYSGQNFVVRQNWTVETNGPDETIDVPSDAINWSPSEQKWMSVGKNVTASSKITYDLLWSNWHHGQKMDMNDILYSVYFTQEWGSEQQNNDKTFDPEFTSTASQAAKSLVGIKIIDENTVQVYVNFWHFDESEIADWGGVWVTMPWEITEAMEQMVLDGNAAFSRTASQEKNISWLSLIVPKDVSLIKKHLNDFTIKKGPSQLAGFNNSQEYYDSRYSASINWITQKNHAIISNGPFYLESYSPESRIIVVKSFDDPSYPFRAGHWNKFEDVSLPQITKITTPHKIIQKTRVEIPIGTMHTTKVYYFVNDHSGRDLSSGVLQIQDNSTNLIFPEHLTGMMPPGGVNLKLYAVSDSVLRPDIYATSFLVVSSDSEQFTETTLEQKTITSTDNFGIISLIIGAIIIGFVLYMRKLRKRHTG